MKQNIQIILCDVCKQERKDIKRYTITVEGSKPTRVDLCADDAQPILQIIGQQPRRNRRTKTVRTEEEIRRELEEGRQKPS